MTVSYQIDLCKSSSLSFIKILFRWRGSIWKSVSTELFIWILLYYKISIIYRSDWILTEQGKRTFEAIAETCNQKLDYIPLVFLLAFFVNMVVDRWKRIFANMGWIENQALFIGSYIRGDDTETRIQRRNIVRYLCLSQVLVFRDISMRVRRRFPTMGSVMHAGFLLPNELEMLNNINIKYNKYFVPFNWVFALIYKLRKDKKVESDSLMNAIFKEIHVYRNQLADLCNYDWVPVPLAYCQVVFLAVRVYFLICLVARQYIIDEHVGNQVSIDLRVPFMTILQFIFYMGWVKVAESLLNPMGEDDDDFEGNFLIDKNISTALKIVDGGYDAFPDQKMDAFMYGQEPLYSSETAASTVNELVGSVAAVTFSTKEDVEMVPHEQKAAKETLDSDDTNSGLHPRKTSHYHKIMNRVKHMSLKKTRRNAVVYFKESEVPSTTAQPSFIATPPPLQRSQSVPANSARICLPRPSLPASLSFGMVNEVDKGCLLSSLRFETLNEVDEVDEEDEDSQQPVAI